MLRRNRSEKIYATTRRRFSEAELRMLRFRPEGSGWIKRGACRVVLATAGADGRVTPLVRGWRY
ncbi:MAG: hypothetical protein PHV02_03310 [Rhodocyclaceae bacterium]|nr:hypothetical protein [Rhodocyclaceae bacterium]